VVRAVDGISFRSDRGWTLGVVGESGCGKTTTAKLVLGLEEPTGGVIRFEGENLKELNGAGPFGRLSPLRQRRSNPERGCKG
jgi:ABC-type oligopeptide transport system ATPase subunit